MVLVCIWIGRGVRILLLFKYPNEEMGCKFFKTVSVVAKGVRNYVEEIDVNLTDLTIPHRIAPCIMKLLRKRFYYLGTFIWLLWIHLTGKYNPLEMYYR